MTTDTFDTLAVWAIAVLTAGALVLMVVLHRWALRVFVAAVTVLLLAVVLAAKAQVAAIPRNEPEALCNGRVSWLGLTLSGPSQLCAVYRTPPASP